jgi:hypothetical protein
VEIIKELSYVAVAEELLKTLSEYSGTNEDLRLAATKICLVGNMNIAATS